MDTSKKLVHLVIMGVSGSGKTTVAEIIQKKTNYPLAEADDFHSKKNIEKMSSGIPLTDEDRKPWLESLKNWMNQYSATNQNTIMTCSALKRKYRDLLTEAKGLVAFIHLQGNQADIEARIKKRSDHFMPESLASSQFEALEELEEDELGITLDMNESPEVLAEKSIRFCESI